MRKGSQETAGVGRIGLLIALAIVAVLAIAGGLVASRATRQEAHVASVLPNNDGDIVDVDGDGVDEVLTWLRESTPTSPRLYLAAIDTTTGVAKWSAGPWASVDSPGFDFRVQGSTVVVGEPSGDVLALDLRSGAVRWRRPTVSRPHEIHVCADDAAARRVRVTFGGGAPVQVLELETGKPLPHHARVAAGACPGHFGGLPPCVDDDVKKVVPCDALRPGTRIFRSDHRFKPSAQYRDVDRGITVGWKIFDPPKDGGATPPPSPLWLSVWKDGKNVVDTAVPTGGVAMRPIRVHHAYGDGVLFSAFTFDDGPRHLFATRVDTGALVWTSALERAARDPHVRWMLARNGKLYVRTNEDLSILDGRSGSLLRRLGDVRLSIDVPRFRLSSR